MNYADRIGRGHNCAAPVWIRNSGVAPITSDLSKAGVTTSYPYNALGQRIVKQGSSVPTGATRYIYDEAGHLIGEYDQAGNAIQETVYFGNTPIATIKNGAAYYIYADQIDTPRVITDTNNLMVWRQDYGM